MPITRADATQAMKDIFFAAWKQKSPAFNNSVMVTVDFDNKEDPEPPDPKQPRAVFMIRHADQPQVTIAPKGSRRYRAQGSVFVNVKCPLGEGTKRGEALCKIVSDAMRGAVPAGGDAVTLRKAVTREYGRLDNTFYEWIVEVAFEYDEIA